MNSLLAAVRAAAQPDSPPDPAGGQHQEASMAQPEKPAERPAANPTTAAELSAAFPDIARELRAEGANAERQRILGIEALAVPGYESIVAECKADSAVTPEQAALRIVTAQREAAKRQMTAIKDVETVTGVVKASPSSSGSPAAPAPQKASTPDEWKAEYAASVALQAEFASDGDYVAFKKGEASGRIRILRRA